MTSEAVIWHDVECAAYDIDLPLWRELAEEADGPILDIGAGTGRVALDLARRGHDVTAIDSDPELVAELAGRARARGMRVATATADGPVEQVESAVRQQLVVAIDGALSELANISLDDGEAESASAEGSAELQR